MPGGLPVAATPPYDEVHLLRDHLATPRTPLQDAMGSTLHRLLLPLLLAIASLTLLAPASLAQSPGKTRPFPAHGVEFKPLKDMSDVPANDRMKSLGVIAQLDMEKSLLVKMMDDRDKETNERMNYAPSLKVARLDPPKATTGDEDDPLAGLFDERGPETVQEIVQDLFRGWGDVDLEATGSEAFKGQKGLNIERYMVSMSARAGQYHVPVMVDVYVFHLEDFKLVMCWDYPDVKKYRKKWESAVEKSMKSVKLMRKGAQVSEVGEVNSESSYEDLLAFHQDDVDQTPGWRLVETPSKRYLIKTNVEKKDNADIKSVISRIEAARTLYEQDFPPTTEITSVSVIRVCASRDEFGTYGQTGGGVAGYFNPGSEELVLFFDRGMSADSTLSVMAHEGFHQYCHFLFNRSEAHRWFDEGHGDYYGAFKQKGKRLVPNEDMKGGLARLPEIKEMYKAGTIKPLSEHIRYNHPQWQSQGPSNVSCYAQSFALVYYLREGSVGRVSRRYWDKEYAKILPAYMETLDHGYRAAYAAIVAEAEKDLAELESGEEISATLEQAMRDRIAAPWDYLGRGEKQEIWDKAMEASWGQVDEAEFEERWLKFVDDVL